MVGVVKNVNVSVEFKKNPLDFLMHRFAGSRK